jgi:putative pyruvate formate lyase activating enzyme
MRKHFENKVQIYLPDLKYSDNMLALRCSAVPDYREFALPAIKEMFRQTGSFEIDDEGIMRRGVIIRHLILPGEIRNTLGVIDMVAKNFKPGEVLFSLMRQYLPCGENIDLLEKNGLNRRVSDEEYEIIENALFDSGIEDGFVQESSSASAEFIPLFDGTGV